MSWHYEVKQTNKDKSKEMVPPLLLTPPYVSACALCNAESKKGSNFKEDDRPL